jgi:MFS transporter, OFA family, oxalate/formate antiporter
MEFGGRLRCFFGFGAGSGYGLALALATRTATQIRAISIGIVVAAFAAGGVVVSSLAASAIAATDPQISFAVIGTSLVATGVAVAALLENRLLTQIGNSKDREFEQKVSVLSIGLLVLTFSFFLISYVGLMIVSHVTTILAAKEVSAQVAGLGPVIFTFGYVIGSFFGGKLVEVIGGWPVLILAHIIDALGVTILALPTRNWALLGALTIGTVFGSSASFMPMIIGEQFGVDRIGLIYGKVLVSYGVAGLLAPWVTGLSFVNTGSYAVAFLIGAAASVTGAILGLAMVRTHK